MEQNRVIGTGQYTFDGGLDRMCICGHLLGNHCATRLKVEGGYLQDCMVGTLGDGGATCECQCFKPSKKK